MASSQNGWPAGTQAQANVAVFVVPGTAVRLPVNREAAPALLEFARWWHTNVEPLTPGHCWGWANRPIRGSTATSNHASGTAIDLNAPKHPLGAVGTVPASKRAAIAAKASSLGLRWGGTYSGRKDEMHAEVIVTRERMRQIVAALQKKPAPKPPAPAPAPGARPTIRNGSRGAAVSRVQQHLKRNYPLYAKHLVVDGIFGGKTEAAVREFQRRSGLVADGIVGPKTWARLGI
jgi:hypothetical protein